MILTLWNEFQDTEGTKLANTIANAPIIIGMRLKVTTFNNLSLSSRISSALLLNPQIPEEMHLREWYNENKNEFKAMIESKSYKDATALLPPPQEEDIIDIEKTLTSFQNHKTAWVQGTTKLARGQLRYWFTACANCHKSVHADVEWNITCPSCKENSRVEIRCRIVLLVTDSTGTLNCLITGRDAEKLIPFTAQQLKAADDDGISVDEQIADSIKKYKIVCFVRSYDAEYQGQTTKRNSIIKAYMMHEIVQKASTLTLSETVQVPCTIPAHTPMHDINKSKDLLFSPTTKLILQEIVENTTATSSPLTRVKRVLQFNDEDSDDHLSTNNNISSHLDFSSAETSHVRTTAHPSAFTNPAQPTPSKKNKNKIE